MGGLHELNDLSDEIDHTRAIYAEVLPKVMPSVEHSRLQILNMELWVERFIRGVQRLTEGYLSPLLINHEEIKKMLERVNEQIRLSCRANDFKLITQSPSYYYNLQNVAYTHRFK